ncbi:hypothetical protein YB2330_004967 [Saitoella coloradoensis]
MRDFLQPSYKEASSFKTQLGTTATMSLTTGDKPKVIAHHAPITASRQPALIRPSSLPYPGTARAHKAAIPSAPNGTEKFNYHIPQHRSRRDVSEMSVMQLHCAFWDPDNDGVINPWDTFLGFRALGYNLLLCLIAMFIIHSGFSYPTRLHHSYIPDPLFRVYLDGIHKAKHGSDTNTYDPEGRFRPQQFEDIFAKYANPATPNKLSIREVFSMIKGQRVVLDPFGWGAAIFEWYATIVLIAHDGYIEKEDLRRIYDGTLFYTIAGQNRSQEPWGKGFWMSDIFNPRQMRGVWGAWKRVLPGGKQIPLREERAIQEGRVGPGGDRVWEELEASKEVKSREKVLEDSKPVRKGESERNIDEKAVKEEERILDSSHETRDRDLDSGIASTTTIEERGKERGTASADPVTAASPAWGDATTRNEEVVKGIREMNAVAYDTGTSNGSKAGGESKKEEYVEGDTKGIETVKEIKEREGGKGGEKTFAEMARERVGDGEGRGLGGM